MELIEELARAHRDDKDSGESLVEDLRLRLHRFSERERRTLEAELTTIACNGLGDLAGVALEVLVREGTKNVDLLYEMFSQARTDEWRDQLALALMRLGPGHLAGPLAEHIARVLNDAHASGATELGYLHRIDPKAFYDLAVPYLTQTLRNGDSRQVAGLLPVYVGQLSDDDGAPLMELLDQICRRDTRAASTFAKGIVDFLSKPWASAHVDSHTISALRSRLNTWRCASR